MSPFTDVGGSRIIFAGPSKVFTQANKDQQRELTMLFILFTTLISWEPLITVMLEGVLGLNLIER